MAVAHDEALIRQDARDQLMHQCSLNSDRQLGAARLFRTDRVVCVSIQATAFSRPCIPVLLVDGAGTYTPGDGAWRLRHVRQEHPVLTMHRGSAEIKRKSGLQPEVHFVSMTWSSRQLGLLVCMVHGLRDGSTGTVRIVDVPNDDSRCVHRLLTLPALVRIVSACDAVTAILDTSPFHAALASLNSELHYTAVTGIRRPEWLPREEWLLWLKRIVDKGAPPSYDHLPASITGTLYDSLCLALGAAACADAQGTPLLHRGVVAMAAADALRTHMDTVATDGIEHAQCVEKYNGSVGRWRAAAMNIVVRLRAEAAIGLAAAIVVCSGNADRFGMTATFDSAASIDSAAAIDDLSTFVKTPMAPCFVSGMSGGVPKPFHEDEILAELAQTPAPWAPLVRSAAVTAWMRPHWEEWHPLVFVPCTSFCTVNMFTGEVVGFEARPPPGWQPISKGIPGSPVWLQGEQGVPFPWDCRAVPEGVLMYAQRRPDTLVPFPYMVVEGSHATRPALPSADQVSYDNSYAILSAAFNLPLYGTLRLVDGIVCKVDPSTGWVHPMATPVRLPPALLAKWALGPGEALVAIGADGCARDIPCRPYRLALEAMDVDSVRFYPLRDGKPVSILPIATYDAILARRGDAMPVCNVSCAAVCEDMVWSPQPACLDVVVAGDVVYLRPTPMPPIHRPFIAVSNAAGEVIQIVNELTGAPPLYRKSGHCSVLYCPRAQAPDSQYCTPCMLALAYPH